MDWLKGKPTRNVFLLTTSYRGVPIDFPWNQSHEDGELELKLDSWAQLNTFDGDGGLQKWSCCMTTSWQMVYNKDHDWSLNFAACIGLQYCVAVGLKMWLLKGTFTKSPSCSPKPGFGICWRWFVDYPIWGIYWELFLGLFFCKSKQLEGFSNIIHLSELG